MREHILLIEDNEQNGYLLTYLLTQHGFKVTQAYDGLAGIKLAASLLPDLILVDIQLPYMDGYHVVKNLRELNALAQTPIVAVTAYAMLGDREKALRVGYNGYIEKPINPDTFVHEASQFINTDVPKG